MSQTSSGAPRIGRAIMPPYRLSADLLRTRFETPSPPPPDAFTSWRRDRIRRLIQGIVACQPTDAAQARIVAQVLGTLALADTILTRAQAPEVKGGDVKAGQSCRPPAPQRVNSGRVKIRGDENPARHASLLACRTAQGGQ